MATTSANMGLSIPTLNGDPGSWDGSLNASLALIDTHDHQPGAGVKVPTGGLNINSDLTFAGNAATNLKAVAFTAQSAYTTNNALWVNTTNSDLYYRRSGTDNRLTVNGVLNVSIVGGIAGDYTASAASLYYDDAAEAYRFLEAAPSPNDWSYVKAGGVDLYEHASGIANFVALRSPAALAASYTVTFPAALPGSTVAVQCGTGGALTFSNTFATLITANAGVVTNEGDIRHAAVEHVVSIHSCTSTAGTRTDTKIAHGSGFSVYLPIVGRVGSKITTASIRLDDLGGAGWAMTLRKMTLSTQTDALVATGSGAGGDALWTATPGTPETITTDTVYYVRAVSGGAGGEAYGGSFTLVRDS